MNNEQINAIYNSFGKKDMTRADFHAQMHNLTDPKRLADEANSIARGEINRKKINMRASDLP